MQYANMFVTWLKSHTEETGHFVAVDEEIIKVFQLFQQEGAEVQIVKIEGDGDEVEVKAEQVEDGGTYTLNVNLANSHLSFSRFNELIENWVICEVS